MQTRLRTNCGSGATLRASDLGETGLLRSVGAESVDEAGAGEMRARHEPHEWTQTWRGQGAGEEQTRDVGFEVAIQHWSATEELEVGAQGRRHVVEAGHVEAEAGARNDVICALGDVAPGVAQVEPDALTYLLGADELVPEEHRYRPFDSVP